MKLLNPEINGCNLGLLGPPGVGKTMIATSLGRILGIPFQKIFMGSAHNVDFLKGSGKVWVGTGPGIVVKRMCDLGVSNGILYFDELNRIFNNPVIETALLQIMDPSQNKEFDDNFLEDIPVDLSKVWFISSMNKLPNNRALRDRMYIIEVPGYSFQERVDILSEYIFQEVLGNYKLDKKDITLPKSIAKYIVGKVNEMHPENKGMRMVKNAVENIIKKVCFLKYNKDIDTTFSIDLTFPVKLSRRHVDRFIA